jgi:hypothetical protein
MKKEIFLCAIAFFYSISFTFSKTLIGGEISYRNTGINGIYEITYTFYRNCVGLSAPTSFYLYVEEGCGNYRGLSILPYSSYPGEILLPMCPNEPSTCNNGSNELGIDKYVYKGTIVLPSFCEHWRFTVSNGMRRSYLITTIEDPDMYSCYISAYLNFSESDQGKNNSPVFNIEPVFETCINQYSCIDPGVYDPDGDSLVFSLTTPLSFDNMPLPYKPGYSSMRPIKSNPPLKFDPATGKIYIFPKIEEVGTYALTVSEFRNGKMIGQVVRDVILKVSDCNTVPPDMTGFYNTSFYRIAVCAGQETCLPVYTEDLDANDHTFITWDKSIPEINLLTSGSPFESGLFCWTPAISEIRDEPYCFNASVYDNNCRVLRSRTYQYCIYVVDSSDCNNSSSLRVGSENSDLTIFPQPAKNLVYIDLGNEFNPYNNYRITISNILGETVVQTIVNKQINSFELPVNTPSGIYPVFVTDPSGRIIKKDKIIFSR